MTKQQFIEQIHKKLRSKAKTAPTLDEITKEVELVRAERYAKSDFLQRK